MVLRTQALPIPVYQHVLQMFQQSSTLACWPLSMLAHHSGFFAMNVPNPQLMKNYTEWKCHQQTCESCSSECKKGGHWYGDRRVAALGRGPGGHHGWSCPIQSKHYASKTFVAYPVGSYFVSQARNDPWIPYNGSLASKMKWTTQSNALERFTNTKPVTKPLSVAFLRSSVGAPPPKTSTGGEIASRTCEVCSLS